ncbi:MAG: ribonuclease P protein component [Porphyromonadaceae bacterium]|nr:MAG: ribonuclease P protein component [Porphyromonadaceae bacterium]
MDLSFPKKEHLCLKRRFDALLAQGKSFFIYPFRVIYLLKEQDQDSVPVQVAISVRKKQFKHAVTRNLIKRRFRESWRLHKSELHACLAKEGKSLYILMVYGANEVLPFSEIDIRMQQIMLRLQEVVTIENVQ